MAHSKVANRTKIRNLTYLLKLCKNKKTKKQNFLLIYFQIIVDPRPLSPILCTMEVRNACTWWGPNWNTRVRPVSTFSYIPSFPLLDACLQLTPASNRSQAKYVNV